MKEIWKDIPGYEGRYKASNFGKLINVETNLYLKAPTCTITDCIRKNRGSKKYNFKKVEYI